MTCTNPVTICNPAIKGYPWARRISDIGNKDGTIKVPCGKCIACRIAKTREWTLRLIHEKEIHKHACFLTLTYDNDHLPSDLGLHKSDFQKFVKRLRKAIPDKIKYFACGEYGDQLGRPHYHAIILGWEPPIGDLIHLGYRAGRQLYSSNTLVETWPFGFTTVGTVTKESCNYVTGYIRKKLNGKAGSERYGSKEPPFQLSSQGIGLSFALSQAESIASNGTVESPTGPRGVPRYYRRKLLEQGIDLSEHYKQLAKIDEENTMNVYRQDGFTDYEARVAIEESYLHQIAHLTVADRIRMGGIYEDFS